jgi:hypothetical protein
MIKENIGKKNAQDERNGMIMNTMGRGNSMGSGKNNLIFGEDIFDIRMQGGNINYLNIMELGNNFRMTFF